jgi:eukaryotic-like serine/threonine-protein kinase
MPLTTGTRLGSSQIVDAIGSGGMGEVYRARDIRLNRDVAIKIVLPAVASDPERVARFSREAQLLASLNHPNIAQVYGIEDDAGVLALIMELVEGPTLADRARFDPARRGARDRATDRGGTRGRARTGDR